MAELSAIEWCDHTFNPWVGCSKVSPGCAHCYAETLVTGRMGRAGTWGDDGTRERTSEANWRKPLTWERNAEAWFAEHGRRQRVFCASLADVFEPRPELANWRYELFALITETPSLDWLLLTKRPEEAREYLTDPYWWARVEGTAQRRHEARTGEDVSMTLAVHGPLPNVWVGTSIENARHTWRADVLREIPAAVRFISAEPLLASLLPERCASPCFPLDGGSYVCGRVKGHAGLHASTYEQGAEWEDGEPARCWTNVEDTHWARPLDLTGIDWVIVGGESGGRDARPMHPEWARELRDACMSFHEDGDVGTTSFFFKQWGSWSPDVWQPGDRADHNLRALDDGQTPEGARRLLYMRYRGASPKSGGRLLDGREWNEMPEPAKEAA